jgi:hypothetical protein
MFSHIISILHKITVFFYFLHHPTQLGLLEIAKLNHWTTPVRFT